MNKRFIVNMSATAVAFVIQIGVNFLLTPYIVNSLGASAYSFIPLINNIVSYSSILTAALDSMAARFIAVEFNKGNTSKANIYFNSVLIADSIIAIILIVPCLLFVLWPNKLMNVPVYLVDEVRMTFFFAAISMETSLLFAAFGCVYYVKNRLDKSALRNIEGNVLRAVVLLALFLCFAPKIQFVTASMLVLNVYMCITNIYYMRKLLPEIRVNFSYFKLRAVKTMLGSGIWNSINQLSYTLLVTLSLYLANIFVGPHVAGLYSLSKTMPSFIVNIINTMASVFTPQFIQHYAKGEFSKLHSAVIFAIKFMGYVCMLPVGFLIVFGVNFFNIWTPGQNSKYLQGMAVLTLISLIPDCSCMIVSGLFTVVNKLRIPSLCFLLCGVCNILFVIPFLKLSDYGIWAIIIISGILDILKNFVLLPMYAARCIGMPISKMFAVTVRSYLAVLPMCFICFLYNLCFSVNNWFTLIGAALVCSLVALIPNFFVVFSEKERKKILAPIKDKLYNLIYLFI